jgi:hypothetical protein
MTFDNIVMSRMTMQVLDRRVRAHDAMMMPPLR